MKVLIHLVTLLIVLSSLLVFVTAINEDQSPLHVRERFRRALSSDDHLVRKRRELELPEGTGWEVKWNLNLPFERILNRYSCRIQIGLPIHIDFPGILFDEYGKAKLKGYEVEPYHHDGGYHDRNGDNDLYDYEYYDTPNKRSTRSIHYSNAAQRERLYLYKNIEGLFEKLGLPARSCLMRTVCEVAEKPLENGMIGDLINLFLTPSLASPSDEYHSSEYSDYVTAEKHGHKGEFCHKKYHQCEASMFQLLPLVARTFFSKSL